MTVESTITKEISQGNGAATVFPVPFQYAQQADLYLLLVAPDGTETPITNNFQVVANESGDTSIAYPVTGNPLAPGYKLVIYRDTPKTQIVDLVYGGAFNPDVLEHDALDRLEMQIQELDEILARAIKVPISSDETPEDFLVSLFGARDEAATSAANALASENLAYKWANNPVDTIVKNGKYSAYHWAQKGRDWYFGQVPVQNGGGLALDGSGDIYVDFSLMPTDKFQALLQSLRLPIWLIANKTWYIRPDGNDNNDGSANTAAKAFRTIQAALNYISANTSVPSFNQINLTV
jgi:hypothetical protein